MLRKKRGGKEKKKSEKSETFQIRKNSTIDS
ncbi:rCG48810 [Rattus norvegicus]|uniref:RCG48810 n=1 Tax=Rattus norvegicus TaxID=10116 RepID=A6IGL0_RAT|nr:rCG48810 [Rattus norvegicus]